MAFKSVHPHLIPNIEDWPIYHQSKNRAEFIQDVNKASFNQLLAKNPNGLEELLARSIYMEDQRVKFQPWKVDPSDEKKYWANISKKFQENKQSKNKDALNEQLLERIIWRYSEEIVGNFKKSTFKFARRFLTALFNRLLNAAKGKNLFKFWTRKHQLYEKLQLVGYLDQVRELAKDGTIVMVPTHFSNLDSILIGYAIDGVSGMPAFSYGAGLNLFDLELVAYFMNRLGAYKVDRRKKNPIYLEVLKTMSNLSIQKGVNNIFFPGGTRSRSGEVESKLKMGLLSTVIEAQRSMLERGEEKKIYIVPLILSYHFVLEAKFMIEHHLRRTGKEKYIRNKDQAKSYSRIFKFIWQLFSSGSEVYMSFGRPMDVFGNLVGEGGSSFDERGKHVAIKDYFTFEGKVSKNEQRENIYTKNLANKIVDSYHRDHVVLSSQMVAFCLFNILKEEHSSKSVFDLVNLPIDQVIIKKKHFRQELSIFKAVLIEMESEGKIFLSEKIKQSETEIIEDGVRNLGMYHIKKPVIQLNNGDMTTQDLKLLYYYSNRLDHFDLDKKISWKKNMSNNQAKQK